MPGRFKDSAGNWHRVDEVVNPPGGGEQRIRLLGPFRITHQTPDLDWNTIPNDIPSLIAIPETAIVQEAWVFLWQGWTAPTALPMGIYVTDGAFSSVAAVTYADIRSQPHTSEENTPAPVVQFRNTPIKPSTGSYLAVNIEGADDATAGEADIYALIAEPVAS